MATDNPVSPKLYAAGAGGLIGLIVPELILTVINLFADGTVVVPEPWQTIIPAVLVLAGTLVGIYFKTDPLRVPTLDPKALARLPEPELALHDAASKLNELPPTGDPFH